MLDARGLVPRLLEDLEHRHLPSSPRRASRAVIATFASDAWRRCATAGAAKPEKTGTWIAPMWAHACEAIATSGAHGQEDRHAVALADAEADERLCELRHLGESSANVSSRREPSSLQADGCDRVRPALRPAVDAVPGDVDLAPDEPRRPLRAAREVDDFVPGLRELEAHVLDRSRPEPLRVLLGAAHELPVVVHPVLAHQADDVRARERLLVRPPDVLRRCFDHPDRLC